MGLISKASLACRRVEEVSRRVSVYMIGREGKDCDKAFRGDSRPQPWAPNGRRRLLGTAWASLAGYLVRMRQTWGKLSDGQ